MNCNMWLHLVYTYVTPRVSWNILGRQLMSAPPRNSSVVDLTGDLGSCLVIAKAIGGGMANSGEFW